MNKWLLLIALFSSSAIAADTTVRWKVLRVVDGDTVEVRTTFMHQLRWYVRQANIDTPELHGKCESERVKAKEAKVFLTNYLKDKRVYFKNPNHGKYGGIFISDMIVNGESLSKVMLDKGFAKTYDGGKKEGWCE